MIGAWRDLSLGDATISLDFRRKPVKEADRRPGPYPYWGASGIVDHVDDYLFDHPSLLLSEDGENLKTRKTPIAFYVDGKYWVNNHAHVYVAAEGYDLRFLAYQLQGASISGYLTGSTQPKLTAGNAARIPIRAPEFSVQRRIAGVLGAFDDLIDTNHGLVGRLEALLAAVFDEEGFDSDSGDGLLGDVISVNPFYRKPTGVAPYVDMAALPTQGARVSAVGSRKAAGGARFTSGDTLLARITPCLENGKTAFVDFLDTDEVGVGSTEFIVLRDQTGVSQHWPYFLARSERFRSYAIRHMTGTSGRQRCPAEAVARYPLAAPEREDLRRFERLAEPLFAAMRQLDAESAELTRTRDEFLPLLMSGRITVDEAWEALP